MGYSSVISSSQQALHSAQRALAKTETALTKLMPGANKPSLEMQEALLVKLTQVRVVNDMDALE